MLPSEAVNRPVFSSHSDAPSLVGTLARNAVISGFKAAMAHFVANRCHTSTLPKILTAIDQSHQRSLLSDGP
jgi:hypothetical protein